MTRTIVDEIRKAEDGPGRASSPRRIAIVLLILVASQIGSRVMTAAAETSVVCHAD